VCARWVVANWGEFTAETRDCIQYEVVKALEAEELHRAGPGSSLDWKRRDLEMIRTLWMRKGAA
jgi:cytolysin (calcineurin-like family phosphatase)